MSNKNNIQSLQQKQPGNTQIPLGITKKTKKASKHIPFKTQTEREPPQKKRDT